jgi:hypothetical protein
VGWHGKTLDMQHKRSLDCITGMKCGCVVVGASCLKEGWRAKEEQPTYWTKPDGRKFIIRVFSIYVLLLRQWEFPSYSFPLAVQGQSSPSKPIPFPCMDVPMTIYFKTSITFLALSDHYAALRCISSIVGPFPVTSPLKNHWNLDCRKMALKRSFNVVDTRSILNLCPFLASFH